MRMYQGKRSTAVEEGGWVDADVELEDETRMRRKEQQDVETVLQTPVVDVDSLYHSFRSPRIQKSEVTKVV